MKAYIEESYVLTQEPKPFLRWAGGKNWLLKYLEEPLSSFEFKNYHEPFLGGASVFLFLKPPRKAFLSDLNPELIRTYLVVRDNVERLIKELKKYRNSEAFYYFIRDFKTDSQIKKAAKFIYLNQTSFNGIYRVNLKGEYNVPYGFRKKNFLTEHNLRVVSNVLKSAEFQVTEFGSTLKSIKKGDLVFLDPPYTVSHNNNGFIKYNQRLFSLDDQYKLFKYIMAVKKKGAYYILTNAAHKKINEIFGDLDHIVKLKRPSLVGGTDAHRGNVTEYLFTNIPTFYKL